MRHFLKGLALIACALFFFSASVKADLINGNFKGPGNVPSLAGWTNAYGETPTATPDGALFSESAVFSQTQLEQGPFLIQPGIASIQFDLLFATTPGGVAAGNPPDSFQAALFDSTNTPVASSGDPSFPAYYAIDTSFMATIPSPLVTVTPLGGGVQRIRLDLSGFPSQNVLLEFVLNGGDDGQLTTALISNVQLIPSDQTPGIPEPGTLLLMGGLMTAMAGIRPLFRSRNSA